MEYPFRDDGMLVWNAIGAFVSQYIDVYYTSDADVREDSELQEWMAEMGLETKGHLEGTPERVESRAELVRLLQRHPAACPGFGGCLVARTTPSP